MTLLVIAIRIVYQVQPVCLFMTSLNRINRIHKRGYSLLLYPRAQCTEN